MITNGQVSVAGSARTLVVLPPGPATLLLSNAGTSPLAYIGMGSTVSAASGFPLPQTVTPVAIPLYAGSAGGTVSVIASSGTASVAWLLSNPTGQTGF